MRRVVDGVGLEQAEGRRRRPRWLWVYLALVALGSIPLAKMTIAPTQGIDHLDRTIFLGGGGGGGFGTGAVSDAQQRALNEAIAVRSLGATALLIVALLAAVLIPRWTRRSTALAATAAAVAGSLFVLKRDVDLQVRILQVPLRGQLRLHFNWWYWVLFWLALVAVLVGLWPTAREMLDRRRGG